jgi:drug/metabolite transporter (DMT)-like permease
MVPKEESIRSSINTRTRPGGPLLAILSAVLFGASTPLAKLLLGDGVDAWLLAGLLYLGSGIGLAVIYGWQRMAGRVDSEAPLRRSDLPWLGLVVLAGGVIGPVLLMYGLTRVPASSAALLLNLEAIATLALAWVVFHEHVDRKLLLGAGAIVAGAVLLSWRSGALHAGIGAAAIAGACVAWGVDNNLTRKLSSADPVQIAMIKGLVAGSVNLGLAALIGARLPDGVALAGAGLVGFFGYGASLVLFVLALRHLGAARTGAYFSTAPFLGTVLAVLLLAEPVTPRLIIAGVLMAVGVYLHLAERHEHEHTHEAMAHEHRHRHDAEHQHEHDAAAPPGEPHSHWHTHAPIVHSHPHYPDLHHRHGHAPKTG